MGLRGRALGDDGARAFTALHGYRAPAPAALAFRLPRKYLADLYDITRVEGTRRMDLGFGQHAKPFYHDFKPGHGPTIATDADGWGFLINGKYTVTDHGIEDTDMVRYMVQGPGGRFIPAAHYSQSPTAGMYAMHRQSNPWNPMLSVGLLVMGGLLGGMIVNAAVQALPARVGDTVKDGVSLVLAALALYVPSSMPMGRWFGVGVGAVLVGGVVNRRTDASNRVVGYIHTKFAALYDRVLPAPAGGAPGGLPAGAPGSTPASNPTAGIDAFGLPTVNWTGSRAGY